MGLTPVLAELEIARPPLRRLGSLIAMVVIVGLIGLVVAMLLVVAGLEARSSAAAAAWLVAALSAIAGSAALARSQWRRQTRGAIRLQSDALSIAHGGVFKKSLELPVDEIAAACVDEGDPSRQERFVVSNGDGPSGSALWEPQGSTLPYLGPVPGTPNLALVFRKPVRAPAPIQRTEYGPLKNEGMVGALVTVSDPEQARQLFSELRLLRPLDAGDLERVKASGAEFPDGTVPREEALRRHLIRAGWIAVAAALVLPPLGAFGAAIGVRVYQQFGARAQGAAMVILGIGILAARLAL